MLEDQAHRVVIIINVIMIFIAYIYFPTTGLSALQGLSYLNIYNNFMRLILLLSPPNPLFCAEESGLEW